jgi:uncharacterized CHY-type Zn-finger protein
MIIKHVCAWCGSELKPPTMARDDREQMASHGICPACAVRMRKEEAGRYMSCQKGGTDFANKAGDRYFKTKAPHKKGA